MKTVIHLGSIIDERSISKNGLLQLILNAGVQTNTTTLTRLINNEIKRLPMDLAGAICNVLQLTIDDWIQVVDPPVELLPMDLLNKVPHNPRRTKLQYQLDQRDWSQTDLIHCLGTYGFPDRVLTIHKIYSGKIARIPVELIAPISACLGVTPGQWIDVDTPVADGESILEVLDSTGMDLKEIQRILSNLEVTTNKAKSLLAQQSSLLRPASMTKLLDDLEAASKEYAQLNHYLQQYNFGHTDVIPEDLAQQLKAILQSK